MVINGNIIRKSDLTVAILEGDRIHFPAHLVEMAGFTGKEQIRCRLLVVTPGRYRLISKQPVDAEGDLSKVLRGIERAGEIGDVLENTQDNARAGIRARLIDCVVSPQEKGWRVNFPETVKHLVSEKEERSFVFVFSVAGYIEFWFPDTLRRAVSVSISDVLS
jgi:hypothetical protein